MSNDKQIKELADGIFVNCQACLLEEEAETIAKYVIEKEGYRKASDVALEVIEYLEDKGLLNMESWGVAELKKKYTEDEG